MYLHNTIKKQRAKTVENVVYCWRFKN